jgi:hypothetical protein
MQPVSPWRMLALLGLLLPLGGCIMALDPLLLAMQGPSTGVALAVAGRPLGPDTRLAVLLRGEGAPAAALRHCVAEGMRARLPEGRPAPEEPDAAIGAQLLLLLEAEREDGRLPPGGAGTGFDWLVTVEDATEASGGPGTRPVVQSGGSGGMIAIAVGQTTQHHLLLRGAVHDLQRGWRLGHVTAAFDTEEGSMLVAGIAGGAGAAMPFVLPVIVMPGGTSAMAICTAFGRTLAEALVAATTPLPAAEP